MMLLPTLLLLLTRLHIGVAVSFDVFYWDDASCSTERDWQSEECEYLTGAEAYKDWVATVDEYDGRLEGDSLSSAECGGAFNIYMKGTYDPPTIGEGWHLCKTMVANWGGGACVQQEGDAWYTTVTDACGENPDPSFVPPMTEADAEAACRSMDDTSVRSCRRKLSYGVGQCKWKPNKGHCVLKSFHEGGCDGLSPRKCRKARKRGDCMECDENGV